MVSVRQEVFDACGRAKLSRRQVIAAAGAAAAAGAMSAAPLKAHGANTPANAPAARPAESAAGMQGGGFYRFKVGDAACTVIADGAAAMPAHPLWRVEGTKDEVDALLHENFREGGLAGLYIQPLVIQLDGQVVLVDTGNGGARAKLLERMELAGIAREAVTLVAITHLHGDHIGGLMLPDGAPAFPNASYVLAKAEHDFWTGTPDFARSTTPNDKREGSIKGAVKAVEFMRSKLTLLEDGATFGPGLRAVLVAGHTPGLMSIELTSKGEKLTIANDVVHHDVLSFQRPAWTLKFDTDAKAAGEARRTFLSRMAEERTRVFSYHLPFPALGNVRAAGDAFAWVPVPWVWE